MTGHWWPSTILAIKEKINFKSALKSITYESTMACTSMLERDRMIVQNGEMNGYRTYNRS